MSICMAHLVQSRSDNLVNIPLLLLRLMAAGESLNIIDKLVL